jgi:hypothetical protein
MGRTDRETRVAALLGEAAETHHRVYRIVDGADDDWATWYSDWLVNLSELPHILGATPVRSALTALLVGLGEEADAAGEAWQDRYARAIVSRFGA